MDPFGPVHRRAIMARAMENQMFALMVNRCGAGDDNLTSPGEPHWSIRSARSSRRSAPTKPLKPISI